MKAAIVTIPKRSDIVQDLVALIRPSVDSVTLFVDEEYRGNYWNHARTLRAMLDNAADGEPVLIMTDDATTVPDWRERWERIHAEAQNRVYCLFNRQRHLFTPENIARGWVTKLQLRGFYDVATVYINQHRLMDKIDKWLSIGGRNLPRVRNRTTHLDVMIQEFYLYHNMPWTIATPTLFDHRLVASSLGHKIEGSPCYVGAIN